MPFYSRSGDSQEDALDFDASFQSIQARPKGPNRGEGADIGGNRCEPCRLGPRANLAQESYRRRDPGAAPWTEMPSEGGRENTPQTSTILARRTQSQKAHQLRCCPFPRFRHATSGTPDIEALGQAVAVRRTRTLREDGTERGGAHQIGRASCRERGEISVVAV